MSHDTTCCKTSQNQNKVVESMKKRVCDGKQMPEIVNSSKKIMKNGTSKNA
jgi:hypothetical protein